MEARQLNSCQRLVHLETLRARVRQRGIDMNVIQKLKNQNVVDFDLSCDSKVMEVAECCDHYYEIKLDKSEVHELIQELILMHDRMV